MDIKKSVSSLFEGKKKYITIPLIAIVGVLGIRAGLGNKNSSSPVINLAPENAIPSSSGDGTSNSTELEVEGLRQYFNDAFKEQQNQYQRSLGQLLGQYQDDNNSQLARMSELENLFNSTQQKSSYNTDNLGYGYSRSAETPISNDKQVLEVAKLSGAGIGGANYNTSTKEVKQFMESERIKLQNDSIYRQQDLERSLKVKADMQSKGLDTSAQDKHINYLKSLG